LLDENAIWQINCLVWKVKVVEGWTQF